jgi:hypothetical protein
MTDIYDHDSRVIEPIICSTCRKNKWELHLRHDMETRKTFLVLICSNNTCVTERAVTLGCEPDCISWEEFDITGQGYDPTTAYPIQMKDLN